MLDYWTMGSRRGGESEAQQKVCVASALPMFWEGGWEWARLTVAAWKLDSYSYSYSYYYAI